MQPYISGAETVCSQAHIDQELENEIDAACECGFTAPTEELQRAAFLMMAALIAKRSAAQVARMERDQGIR